MYKIICFLITYNSFAAMESTSQESLLNEKHMKSYQKSFSYKYLELSRGKKLFYGFLSTALGAKSISYILKNYPKTQKIIPKYKNIVLSMASAAVVTYASSLMLEKFSFYNLQNALNSGRLTSSIYMRNIFPQNLHTRGKFLKKIETEVLKEFLTFFEMDFFVESLQSEYFCAKKAVEVMEFYREKNRKEYLKCLTKEGLKIFFNTAHYTLQKSVAIFNSIINNSDETNENKKAFKENLLSLFNTFFHQVEENKKYITEFDEARNEQNYKKITEITESINYKKAIAHEAYVKSDLVKIFMSLDYQLQSYIVTHLKEEVKTILYNYMLSTSFFAANYISFFREFFINNPAQAIAFSLWYLKNKKEKQRFFERFFFIRDMSKNLLLLLRNKEIAKEDKEFFVKEMCESLESVFSVIFFLKDTYEEIFKEKTELSKKTEIIEKIKEKLIEIINQN